MERYHVTGMGCEACVKRVQNAVAVLEGVTSVSVDLQAETLSVEYNKDKMNFAAIRNAVDEAGYGLEEM